jgi:hypothetical protein
MSSVPLTGQPVSFRRRRDVEATPKYISSPRFVFSRLNPPMSRRPRSEECRPYCRHGVDQQPAIERDVARLATRFGDEQGAMACGAVEHAVSLGVNRIVSGADGGPLRHSPYRRSERIC